MKKVCIFFFSGTGMTKYVTKKIEVEFKAQGLEVELLNIESGIKDSFSPAQYDYIGITFPVHAFNAPKIVVNFAKKLPKANSARTFILSTAGENNRINYAAANTLIKVLEKKDYKVFYNWMLEMPSNFVVKYDDKKVEEILDNVDIQIPSIIKEIENFNNKSLKITMLAKILAFVGKAEWLGAKIIGKFFYTKKEECTQCEKCVHSCPNNNIELNNDVVRFKWNCGLCMRCVYSCPQRVILVAWPFKFIRLKSWYNEKRL